MTAATPPEMDTTPERMNVLPGLGISAIMLAVMGAISLYAWQHIPADARLPMHWNTRGEVDGWGGRTQGLLLMPCVAVGITLLLAVIPLIDPRRSNLARSQKAYTAIWIASVGMMTALHFTMVSNAMGAKFDVGTVMLVCMGALFMVIGNFLGKIQSNFFCGIRTPWTLSSELSWRKTHRFGRWLFMLEGLALWVLAALGMGPAKLAVLMTFVIAGVPAMLVYSYIVWKNDPARVAAAG